MSDEIADLLIKNLIDINKVNINSFAISKVRFKNIDSYIYILVDIEYNEPKGFIKTLYKKVYTVSNIEQSIIIEIYIDSNDCIKEIDFSKNIFDAILNKIKK